MDVLGCFCLDIEHFELKGRCAKCLENAPEFANSETIFCLSKLRSLRLLNFCLVDPLAQVDAADFRPEEGICVLVGRGMPPVLLQILLKTVECDQKCHSIVLLNSHVAQGLLGFDLVRVLEEGSERLLEQFLNVVGCHDCLV